MSDLEVAVLVPCFNEAAAIAKESAKTKTPIPELLRAKGLLSEEEIGRIFTPEFLSGQADRRYD